MSNVCMYKRTYANTHAHTHTVGRHAEMGRTAPARAPPSLAAGSYALAAQRCGRNAIFSRDFEYHWPLGDHAHTKMAPDPGQKWRHMENKELFDAVLACNERALQKLLTDGASPDGHKTKEVMFALKTNSSSTPREGISTLCITAARSTSLNPADLLAGNNCSDVCM